MQVIARHFPRERRHQQLTGQQVTCAAAAGSSWVHFACHAAQEDTSPDRSGFVLHDGVLTVSDLIAQSTQHHELAFLSACETATGSTRHPDEAIHLAAAMLFLGYRHVIATMWSIGDSEAPKVADTVYTMLTRNGIPDAQRAAEAVHHAIRAFRSDNPTRPQAWAPYLHFGP
jgi:CHAT domain-containing protein